MATATPTTKKLQMANDDVINNQFENDKIQDYEWPPNVSCNALSLCKKNYILLLSEISFTF